VNFGQKRTFFERTRRFNVLFLDNYLGVRASEDNGTSTKGGSGRMNCAIRILNVRELDVECWSFVAFNVYGDGRVNKGLVQAPDPSAEKEAGSSRSPFEAVRMDSAARVGDDETETTGANIDPLYRNHIGTGLKEIGRVSRTLSVRGFFVGATRQVLACCLQGRPIELRWPGLSHGQFQCKKVRAVGCACGVILRSVAMAVEETDDPRGLF
jgi:hypothetical protein